MIAQARLISCYRCRAPAVTKLPAVCSKTPPKSPSIWQCHRHSLGRTATSDRIRHGVVARAVCPFLCSGREINGPEEYVYRATLRRTVFFYRNRRSKAPTDLFYQKEIIKKVQSKTKGTKIKKEESYMPLSQVSMSDAQLFFVLGMTRANSPLKVSLHFPT
jgi:hypothetical protein